ncbi:Rrf2 family transcriptional regulator [Trinickia caryophylli]|uniref:Transcriptional regulator, BadM/Rrf2 family n=1 Tax=Trinickia caryophylli TaxID=28094 RepID=A0A1X7DY59_TRICW|nr:Rrf2 family transcriptional regulator [Trinickia caryophylli]PMS14165.1 Rrf2 family transcriptional regulator [Trinickia caryophylli]TRX17861.1 Rrf2 family transcriptional regulator [Trinickia caryophylli]WQE11370.1 Rrf2 family transcriptional regulator [Trinickia caryophylli]SMF23709.1 transcriptional regulator, BadM/Rrf2 family [Trinickia caryophylli]GLU32528.1 Rrf2 family transcriptional regulator [Trinickia caryophylli]
MNTSSRFAYAVHILALLSLQEGAPLSSEIIAGSVNTNPALIRRLLTMLAAAGLTTAQLGAGGGALLAREPQAIALLDVYRAVEEGQLFGLHRDTPNPACLVGRHIQEVLVGVVDEAQRALEASLAARTLADVTAGVVQAERQLERKRQRG